MTRRKDSDTPRERWRRGVSSVRWMAKRFQRLDRWEKRSRLVDLLAARAAGAPEYHPQPQTFRP